LRALRGGLAWWVAHLSLAMWKSWVLAPSKAPVVFLEQKKLYPFAEHWLVPGTDLIVI